MAGADPRGLQGPGKAMVGLGVFLQAERTPCQATFLKSTYGEPRVPGARGQVRQVGAMRQSLESSQPSVRMGKRIIVESNSTLSRPIAPLADVFDSSISAARQYPEYELSWVSTMCFSEPLHITAEAL